MNKVYFIACSSRTQGQANNQSYPITKLFSLHLVNLFTLDSMMFYKYFLSQTICMASHETRLDLFVLHIFVVVILPVFFSCSHWRRCQIKLFLYLVPFSPPSLKYIHYCNGIDEIRQRDGIKIGSQTRSREPLFKKKQRNRKSRSPITDFPLYILLERAATNAEKTQKRKSCAHLRSSLQSRMFL
jgi:hypothetical protein